MSFVSLRELIKYWMVLLFCCCCSLFWWWNLIKSEVVYYVAHLKMINIKVPQKNVYVWITNAVCKHIKKASSAILTFDSESTSAPHLYDMLTKTHRSILTYTKNLLVGNQNSKYTHLLTLWGTLQKRLKKCCFAHFCHFRGQLLVGNQNVPHKFSVPHKIGVYHSACPTSGYRSTQTMKIAYTSQTSMIPIG